MKCGLFQNIANCSLRDNNADKIYYDYKRDCNQAIPFRIIILILYRLFMLPELLKLITFMNELIVEL
jgi:hypothetical protein